MIKSRMMGWAGHVACMWEKGNARRVLVWNHEGRRPLGRWEDDIVMGLEEIEWEDTDWIHVTWDRARG
jgi:hypothetical protein